MIRLSSKCSEKTNGAMERYIANYNRKNPIKITKDAFIRLAIEGKLKAEGYLK
jgi:hypothetical protein